MSYHSIINEFRQTAGRLALKHREEKAKRKKPEENEPPEEIDEDPAEEAQETPEEERQEEDDGDVSVVFGRATRHARVVAHRGQGQKRPSGPPMIPTTIREAAQAAGMPPRAKSPILKPRVVGRK